MLEQLVAPVQRVAHQVELLVVEAQAFGRLLERVVLARDDLLASLEGASAIAARLEVEASWESWEETPAS